MATKPARHQFSKKGAPLTFDVMVQTSIGTVEVGDGEMTPTEAAFLLIARWGSAGEFTFPLGPLEEDGVCSVEVQFTGRRDDPTEPGALHSQRL